MLTRDEKGAIIESLKGDIEKAKGIFLTNVIGLTSNDGVALRKEIRDADGKLVVTRNTLFGLASKGTPAEELLSDLKGPQAVAFAFEDAPGVAKALKEAGKTHELVELRGGLLDGKALSVQEVHTAKFNDGMSRISCIETIRNLVTNRVFIRVIDGCL